MKLFIKSFEEKIFREKLEELKSSMDAFRTSKKEIDEKKSKTKEIILKIKPKKHKHKNIKST